MLSLQMFQILEANSFELLKKVLVSCQHFKTREQLGFSHAIFWFKNVR